MIKKNSDCDIDFSSELMTAMPEDCRDLLRQMLSDDANLRITAKDALNHPFLLDDYKRLQVESI